MGRPSGTVTFLFTDVEGSTRLWESEPEVMAEVLSDHDAIVRSAVEAQGGYVFATGGDSFAAAFGRPADAVAAALDAQERLSGRAQPEDCPFRVRMALHTGVADERDGDYFGPTVNRVARLMALGHGGQILCSSTTAELLEDAKLVDLGEHRLRDLAAPVHVFQIGDGTFPTLRSLDSLPSNLPAQPGTFVGRYAELTEVAAALGRSRVVTLTGVGGVGKTRLALQAAADVLSSYRDGAWLVELGPVVDPEMLVEAVCQALEVPERQGQGLEVSLTDFLRAKRLLLVLDNCEHLLDGVAAMVDSLVATCHHITVLATSREGLRVGGEQVVVVPSLELPSEDSALEEVAGTEAVRLFVDRAREAGAGFGLTPTNAVAVVRLVRRLDGIPLALELAAARVRSLSPAELAERLDERFRLLGGGRRTAVERHQTLRRAIDWSYELLTETEQLALMRSSVFAGDFGLEAAEQVLAGEGIDTFEVVDLLGRLVDKSLIVATQGEGTTRYRLLETIRQYAEERLETAGDTAAVRRRHAEHYAAFNELVGIGLRGRDEALWTDRFDAELDNVRAAVSWAIGTDEADLGLRLVAPLSLNGTRAAYAAGSWVEPVVNIPGALDHELYPEVLAFSGWAKALARDLDEAKRICDQALALAQSSGSQVRAWARIAASVSWVSIHRADLDETRLMCDLRASAGRAIGDDYELAGALTLAVIPPLFGGDAPAAISTGDEAVPVARRLGCPTALAYALINAGMAWANSSPAQAIALYEEALAVAETIGNPLATGLGLSQLGILHALQEDWGRAAPYLAKALRNFHRAGDHSGIVPPLVSAAMVLAGLGDDEAAATIFGTPDYQRLRESTTPLAPLKPVAEEQVLRRLGPDGVAKCGQTGANLDFDELVGWVVDRLDALVSD